MNSTHQPAVFKFMTLAQAGQIWLTRKVQEHVKPKTIECCRGYLRPLTEFFGETRIYQIEAGAVVAYQAARQKTVGPSAINHEVNALQQIMRLAACWGRIADHYRPLEEREWQKPKILTAQQEQTISAETANDPELELADIVFTIARNTGVTASELRRARVRDLNFESSPPTFYVCGETSEFKVVPRLIPLNSAAEQACRRAKSRAERLGAIRKDDFLFPFRVNRCRWDASRPASRGWLRKQTQKLRERTGVAELRPGIYRDQLCTEMLEKGIKPEVVEGLLGRVSEKMLAAYQHTQIQTKQEALAQLRGNIIAFPGLRPPQ